MSTRTTALLRQSKTDQTVEASIEEIQRYDILRKLDGWNFAWSQLATEGDGRLYGMTVSASSDSFENMLMLTMTDNELVYMICIEVAPHNYGSVGLYENVAGCLLAFACLKSFEEGNGNYSEYVSFDSKTQLVQLYEPKYGARRAKGTKMFFNPEAGARLIQNYLNQ